MDLGDCRKIHDLALKADYEQAAAKKDYFLWHWCELASSRF